MNTDHPDWEEAAGLACELVLYVKGFRDRHLADHFIKDAMTAHPDRAAAIQTALLELETAIRAHTAEAVLLEMIERIDEAAYPGVLRPVGNTP